VNVADMLQVPIDEIVGRAATLVKQLRDAERRLAQFRAAHLRGFVGQLADAAESINGVRFVAQHLPEPASAEELRRLVLDVRKRLDPGPAVVAMTALSDDRPVVVAAVNPQAAERGFKAGDLVRSAAKVLKGGGGGKPDVAQGGGSDARAVPDAVREMRQQIGRVADR
jgi:alanyl-tRNA synthetase